MRYLVACLLLLTASIASAQEVFPHPAWTTGGKYTFYLFEDGSYHTKRGKSYFSMEPRTYTAYERGEWKDLREMLKQARMSNVPLNATAIKAAAGQTMNKELRADQWTIGNCYNMTHWPAVNCTVPSRVRLAEAVAAVDPRLMAAGSYWNEEGRGWVIGNGRASRFQVPQTVVHGSPMYDQNVQLPAPTPASPLGAVLKARWDAHLREAGITRPE